MIDMQPSSTERVFSFAAHALPRSLVVNHGRILILFNSVIENMMEVSSIMILSRHMSIFGGFVLFSDLY